MKVDWEKAKQLAAKRYEDVITACNKADVKELKNLVTNSLGEEGDLIVYPMDRLTLDDKGCFIYHGFTCQLCDCYELHKHLDDGAAFYVCRVAVYNTRDDCRDWILIPYKTRYHDVIKTVGLFNDLLNIIDEYICTDYMVPVSYKDMEGL